MSEPPTERRIRRILVALDASPHSLAALEAAAELAASLEAKLSGLFVEDADLLHAADLPFTLEVRPLAAGPGPFNTELVLRMFRLQAARARRALEQAAAHAEIEHTFRVAQGHVALEVLVATAETDLLTLGQAGAASSSRRKVGSVARAVVARTSAPVLLLRHGLHLNLPVLTVYDGSPEGRRALNLAVQLVRHVETGPLTVLILGEEAEAVHQLRQAVTAEFGEEMPHLHTRPLTDPSIARLAEVIYEEHVGVLVLPSRGAFFADADNLSRLLGATDCPLLFVP